jgi:hypothetical protein
MKNPGTGKLPVVAGIILRIAVFGTFLGHGIVALKQNPDWVPFLTFWGISEKAAFSLMIAIGILDILIAVSTLLRPNRYILAYATFWAFITALMRPLTGITVWAFIERASNWGAPLALLLLRRAFSSGSHFLK